MKKFDKKIALITGGSTGFGRRISQILCDEGAKVVLWDVNDADGEKTTADIKAAGGEISYLHVDVRDSASIEKAATDINARYGRVDILMNSAGVHQYKTGNVVETDEEEYDKIMDTNVKGIFLCSKYIIPLMPEEGGSIINFASAWGMIVSNKVPIYCASKAAVIHLSKAMALDFAPANIRVNSVCPGTCRTHMVEGIINSNFAKFGFESPDDMWESRRQAHPLGRLGSDEDVSNLAIFLASDEAIWITGSAIVIDGGFTVGKTFTPPKK